MRRGSLLIESPPLGFILPADLLAEHPEGLICLALVMCGQANSLLVLFLLCYKGNGIYCIGPLGHLTKTVYRYFIERKMLWDSSLLP